MISWHRYRIMRWLAVLPILLVVGLVLMVYVEVGIRYLLLFWVIYYPQQSSLMAFCGAVQFVLLTALIFMILWAYLKTALTHPGHSPLFYRTAHPTPAGIGVRPGQRGRVQPVLGPTGILHCRTCQAAKPPRCKHDSVTGECALKFDHTCPWVSNVAGYRNYKSFLLFVAYTALTGFYTAFCCRQELFLLSGLYTRYYYKDAMGGASWKPGLGGMLSVVLSISFAISLTGFLGCHLYIASHNLSTVEASGGRASSYDLGPWENLQQVFGSDWRAWPFPWFTDDALVATRMGTYFRRSVSSVVSSGEVARFIRFRDELRTRRTERFLVARGFYVERPKGSDGEGLGQWGLRQGGDETGRRGQQLGVDFSPVVLAPRGRLDGARPLQPEGALSTRATAGAGGAAGVGNSNELGSTGGSEDGVAAVGGSGGGVSSWGDEMQQIGERCGVMTMGSRSAYAHGQPPSAAAAHSVGAAMAVSRALCEPGAPLFDVALFAAALFFTERCGMGGALQREDDGGAFFEALEAEVARQLLREHGGARENSTTGDTAGGSTGAGAVRLGLGGSSSGGLRTPVQTAGYPNLPAGDGTDREGLLHSVA